MPTRAQSTACDKVVKARLLGGAAKANRKGSLTIPANGKRVSPGIFKIIVMIDKYKLDLESLSDDIDSLDNRGDFKNNEYINLKVELMKLDILSDIAYRLARLVEITEGRKIL